jgi:SAM-dependent methyltransferase
MNTPKDTLTPDYFDAVYTANEDPWQFATSPYERDKYAATLAALPKPMYESGFEIGCSIGVLTQQVALRCHHLLAIDVNDAALNQARKRLADQPQVRLEKMVLPAEFPAASFDLILLSEVGYYWSMEDLLQAQAKIIDHLQPGGQLLLVHWTPHVHDYPLTGDQVHDAFMAKTGTGQPLRHLFHKREEKYRLDLFEK